MQPFVGNVNSFALWAKVLEDVERHGKFDFAICTHTLEDLANPGLVCEMLPVVARRGFVALNIMIGEAEADRFIAAVEEFVVARKALLKQ